MDTGWREEAKTEGYLDDMTVEESDWIEAERDWWRKDERPEIREKIRAQVSAERCAQLKAFLSYTYKYPVMD